VFVDERSRPSELSAAAAEALSRLCRRVESVDLDRSTAGQMQTLLELELGDGGHPRWASAGGHETLHIRAARTLTLQSALLLLLTQLFERSMQRPAAAAALLAFRASGPDGEKEGKEAAVPESAAARAELVHKDPSCVRIPYVNPCCSSLSKHPSVLYRCSGR